MSKESKQHNDPDMLEEYDFSQGVRGKYYKRQYRQEMTKHNQIAGELAIGGITATVIAVLSNFSKAKVGTDISQAGIFTAVGIEAGFIGWQTLQLNKFKERFKRRFVALKQDKLDKEFLESDKFKSLVIQVVESASKTASENKQKALANVLANSVVLPTSEYKHKETLVRVLSQLSDEEMQALKIIYDEELRLIAAKKEDREKNKGINYELHIVKGEEITKKLGWEEEDTQIACEGLSQLALVYDRSSGFSSATGWRITSLAKKLIEFSQNPAS